MVVILNTSDANAQKNVKKRQIWKNNKKYIDKVCLIWYIICAFNEAEEMIFENWAKCQFI